MMGNEMVDENVYVAKSIRRIKHCLFVLAFGVPLIYFLLILLLVIYCMLRLQIISIISYFHIFFSLRLMFVRIQPSNRNYFYSDPVKLIWSSIVPISSIFPIKIKIKTNIINILLTLILFLIFSVFILAFTEAYNEKIKMYRYYHCATLFIYESIWLLLTINLVHALHVLWFVDKCVESFQNMPPVGITYYLFVALTAISYCTYWLQNTLTHIALCRCKISGVSNKSDENPQHIKSALKYWYHCFLHLQQEPTETPNDWITVNCYWITVNFKPSWAYIMALFLMELLRFILLTLFVIPIFPFITFPFVHKCTTRYFTILVLPTMYFAHMFGNNCSYYRWFLFEINVKTIFIAILQLLQGMCTLIG